MTKKPISLLWPSKKINPAEALRIWPKSEKKSAKLHRVGKSLSGRACCFPRRGQEQCLISA